jgi:hypothetical protein
VKIVRYAVDWIFEWSTVAVEYAFHGDHHEEMGVELVIHQRSLHAHMHVARATEVAEEGS